MEKKVKSHIPTMDSIEELAAFWDTHDVTDFESELKEVVTPPFVRKKRDKTVAIALAHKEVLILKKLAKSQRVKESTLLRRWVCEHLRKALPQGPRNKALSSLHKAHRG